MIEIIIRATLTAAVAQGTPLLLTALGRLFGRQGGKGGIQVEVRPVKDFNHGSPPFPRRCSGR